MPLGFRQVIINKRSVLSYRNNWLHIRSLDDVKKIFMDEVEMVIIENPACSITAFCMVEMAKRNIKLVLCDEQHNPISEMLPLYGSYDSSAKLAAQIKWTKSTKNKVWQAIIRMKICQQAQLLDLLGYKNQRGLLLEEAKKVQLGDKTNREGMAARIYFNALFGLDFNRERSGETDFENSALNYGYAVLTSLFNRSVVAAGYSTQLGIFHRSAENQFNLSCDLMEPFRSVVDYLVATSKADTFDNVEKYRMANLIFTEVKIDGFVQTLDNAVPIYLRSVFEALNSGNVEAILRYEL